MEEEILKKFSAQVEILSKNDIEKVVKRLDKDELDTFIEIFEEYNLELHEQLISISHTLKQEIRNHEVLLRNVWNIVPNELRRYLVEHFDSINNLS